MRTETRFPRGESGIVAGPRNGNETAALILYDGKTALSAREAAMRKRLELIVKRGLDAFSKGIKALMIIHDKKLYRNTHRTFQIYCNEVHGKSARAIRYAFSAFEIKETIEEHKKRSGEANGHSLGPQTESQARPLIALSPDRQGPAWDRVERKAELMNSPITAKIVDAVVKEELEKDKWPKPNQHGVYTDLRAETVVFKHDKASVIIFLLRVSLDRWIASMEWRLPTSGNCSPLSDKNEGFPTREAALDFQVARLINHMEQEKKGLGSSNPKSQIHQDLAKRVSEWAYGLRPKEKQSHAGKGTMAAKGETQKPRAEKPAKVEEPEGKDSEPIRFSLDLRLVSLRDKALRDLQTLRRVVRAGDIEAHRHIDKAEKHLRAAIAQI